MTLSRGQLVAGTVAVALGGLLAGVGLASVPAGFAAGISPGARFIVGAVVGLVAALGGLYGAFSWASRRRVIRMRGELLELRYLRAMADDPSLRIVMVEFMPLGSESDYMVTYADGRKEFIGWKIQEVLNNAARDAVKACDLEIFRREYVRLKGNSQTFDLSLGLSCENMVRLLMSMLQQRVPYPRFRLSRKYPPKFEMGHVYYERGRVPYERCVGLYVEVVGMTNVAAVDLYDELFCDENWSKSYEKYSCYSLTGMELYEFDEGVWIGDDPPDFAAMAPKVAAFVPNEMAADGRLLIGTTNALQKVWMDIGSMPHMLIGGQSGFGKSVFLNQLLYGVLRNRGRFERVCLVDLKGGVEFIEYFGLNRVQVVWDMPSLRELMAEVGKILDERLTSMRERRQRTWPGPRLLVVVDEYAQLADYEPEDKDDKQAHARMMAGFRRLAMQGRAAGISLVCCTQKATTDAMESAVRGNLQVSVLFRPPNRQFAASVMGPGDELPIDPMKLDRGQFLYWNPFEGAPRVLRSHRVPEGLVDEVFR